MITMSSTKSRTQQLEEIYYTTRLLKLGFRTSGAQENGSKSWGTGLVCESPNFKSWHRIDPEQHQGFLNIYQP